MFGKLNDTVCIALIVIAGPYLLKLFRWPVELNHQIGFALIGLAGIIYIWLANPNAEPQYNPEIIDEVFARNNIGIQVEEKQLRPLLIYSHKEELNDKEETE
jgi:putative Mn2+ efflux pump MntP